MNNVIFNNAYGILGLIPTATQKDTNKRIKEINKYLQIDNTPQYPYDFGVYNRQILRNTGSVQEASQNIANNLSSIVHSFYRVYCSNSRQKGYLDKIENSFNFENILGIYNTAGEINLVFVKNIAITMTLYLLSGRVKAQEVGVVAKQCISLWHKIFSDNKYMSDFKKLFMSNDEIGMDDSIFKGNHIKNTLLKELTKVLEDISNLYKTDAVLSEFIKIFAPLGITNDLKIVDEIYANIQKQLDILNGLNISDDDYFDDNERKVLSTAKSIINKELRRLKTLGLYNSEKSIVLRDSIANVVRKHSVDLYNNLNDEEETVTDLINFSVSIAGTTGLKNKLEKELATVTEGYKSKKENEQVNSVLEELLAVFTKLDHIVLKNNQVPSTHLINKIPTLINTLKQSTDDSDVLATFDLLAVKLRGYAVHIHNERKNYDVSEKLLQMAIDITTSHTAKSNYRKEIEQIRANAKVSVRNTYNRFTKMGPIGGIFMLVYFIWRVLKKLFR